MITRGVLYMIAAALGFSVMSMLVKVASDDGLPTGEIVLARAIVTLAVSYVMVRRARLPLWGTQRGKLMFRGLLGFGGLTCYYGSLAYLPIADATTIHQSVPLVTALLAWWILREQIGWATAFAIACGIAGVSLIVGGGPDSDPSVGVDPIGFAFAFCAVGCSSAAYVTVRQLARTEHALVIVFYFPLVALPLSIPWAVVDWVWPSPSQWWLLLAIGIATQVGQVFLTMGLSLEKAGRATSLGYIQVVFAMIWQTTLWDSPPGLASIGGAALILAGTLVASVKVGSRGSPDTSARPPA